MGELCGCKAYSHFGVSCLDCKLHSAIDCVSASDYMNLIAPAYVGQSDSNHPSLRLNDSIVTLA